jgi:hypothetical protein
MTTVEFANKIFLKTNIKGIEPLNYVYHNKYKIVVYVPLNSGDEILFQLAAAGAGVIGNYTVCSFRSKGVGTFIGGNKSKPAAGKKGKFEMVEEIRLEMICPEECLNDAIDSIYEFHPYEEPAYEIYPVMIRDKSPNNKVIAVSFKKPVRLKEVVYKINPKVNLTVKNSDPDVWSAVIDFSGDPVIESSARTKKKVLYIYKESKSSYNIRLV